MWRKKNILRIVTWNHEIEIQQETQEETGTGLLILEVGKRRALDDNCSYEFRLKTYHTLLQTIFITVMNYLFHKFPFLYNFSNHTALCVCVCACE